MSDTGTTPQRILVTGGSGFIGTNVVEALLSAGYAVVNLDLQPPVHPGHKNVFRKASILDVDTVRDAFAEFQPDKVIHMAAETRLDPKSLDDFSSNIDGVKNIIRVLQERPQVRRCVFTSTKLVCRNDYAPKSYEETCPDTLYGQSKEIGERLVREADLPCEWCLARPTGIWGPWFHVPYRGFFRNVARGRYVHSRAFDTPKCFGFVGNVVFQVMALLEGPQEQVHEQTFYLGDYDPYTIGVWADAISQQIRGRRVRRVPFGLMWLAAKAGDLLKAAGMANPPMTSFRLKNMQTNTAGLPLANIEALTGPLPYTMQQGVQLTLDWMKRQGLLE